VDSHLHINDPGRAEWEGFETATRAAAAGGYTFLVDMPLNCLPATTTVAALEAKREAARSHCRVDWAAWGGVVGDNQGDIEALAAAGVLGFKCFLIDAGIDGFTMVTEQELRRALLHVARTGLPLLVHAEVAGPVDAATKALADADWRSYATYLKSRPDQAELSAIRLLLLLCREYSFRLHIVHLSTCLAIPELKAARAERLPIPWKPVRTTCTWPPRRLPTERLCASVRRRFEAAKIAKHCGKDSGTERSTWWLPTTPHVYPR
jgi:allantoinase